MQIYNIKILDYASGCVDVYDYEKSIIRQSAEAPERQRSENLGRQAIDIKNSDTGIRSDSIYRTKKNLFEYGKNHLFDFVAGSFITLTFKENLIDPRLANKKFNSWRTSFSRKLKKCYGVDFMYIGVPEFQKRGAVHYHLIVNINPREHSLLLPEQKNAPNKNMFDVFGWKHGFTSCFDFELTDENFNPILYISKYLTKDIDNRLYGTTKLLKSNNLEKPSELLLWLDREDDMKLYLNYLAYIGERSELPDAEAKFKSVSPKRKHALGFALNQLEIAKPKKS